MKTIDLVAAARPNFMKIAPLYHALSREPWAKVRIIHTGQHYDTSLSENFFEDLELPDPDFFLEVGSGTHAEQTAKVLVRYETLLRESPPDLVIVAGDVNSTMAACLAAKKLNLRVAHLEAGLRSFDRTMPEEINRLVTDTLCDFLWTPSPDADENLQKEGISREKIRRVGNIMIDSYVWLEKKKSASVISIPKKPYGVVTLHRPSNVDSEVILKQIVTVLDRIALKMPLIFPVHPRTQKQLSLFGISFELVQVTSPKRYREFMDLVRNCDLVITDSGGLQEETTYLGIPCLTLRENTERPITIIEGTNRLVDPSNLYEMVEEVLSGSIQRRCPELWDGRTSSRIVEHLRAVFSVQ